MDLIFNIFILIFFIEYKPIFLKKKPFTCVETIFFLQNKYRKIILKKY